MKNYRYLCLLCLMIVISFNASAQIFNSFKLLGRRCFGNQAPWDGPVAEEVYFDTNGDLFVLVDEASQPRDPELAKYSFSTDTWTDLSKRKFKVPGGQSTMDGVGMPDGSVIAVVRTFDNEVYVYNYKPDGTFTTVGNNPIFTNTSHFYTTAAGAPNGDIYIAGGIYGSFFHKWDGQNWSVLSDDFTTGTIRNIVMEIDKNGDVYVNYELLAPRPKIQVSKYNSTTGWVNILSETAISGNGELFIDKATDEVYTMYHRYNGTADVYVVKRYDGGNNWIDIGNEVFFDEDNCDRASVVKLNSTGDLYLSNCYSILVLNKTSNTWDEVMKPVSDGRGVTGYQPILVESPRGTLISVFRRSCGVGIDAVELTTEKLPCTFNLTITNQDNTLTSSQTGATYRWLDCDNNFAPIAGATSLSFTADKAGNYAVEITKDGCVDTSGCKSVSCVLNLTITSQNNTLTSSQTGATYRWLDCDNNFAPIVDATNQSFTAVNTGKYAVEVTKDGCVDTSGCTAIELQVLGSCQIFIPNTFTPNNDYINTLFSLKTAVACVKSFQAEIFDQGGKIIATSTDIKNIWDGKNSAGEEMPINSYAYKMIFVTKDNERIVKRGFVNLLR